MTREDPVSRMHMGIDLASGTDEAFLTGPCPHCGYRVAFPLPRLAASPADGAGVREAGAGYEVHVWQKHEPSGVVVLKGHPQLGGRYCLTDGGDWPCATVRAALEGASDRTREERTA